MSTRFVPHIALLALLAGAVVWPAWLSPRRADPCAHADVLPVTGLIPASRPEGERRERLGGDVIQWSEGRVTGSEIPRDMPLFFRIVTRLLPARWFMVLSRGVFLKDASLTELSGPLLALVAIGAFFTLQAVRKFKSDVEP